MLENRIELESNEDHLKRYYKASERLQRNFEFFFDIWEGLPNRVTKSLAEASYGLLEKTKLEDIGRRRFLKVVGSIKIPLTSVRQPSLSPER